ncbi:hypothetical protein QQP08_003862 [Theobroma cacao]|uniref:Uncharacterized protein n=1 Tax=Theobroma cacao TaxID=3641 RepID=A0A061DR12_THECC|nr:Uncharacterized protein TCM_004699 [Theobroma cacao]WRX11375.1 hypothetical protein QQP08_003862 [Theobroma cacao]
MARPSDLERIGIEAFALLEEGLGRKTGPPLDQSSQHHFQPRPQPAGVLGGDTRDDMDCYRAAKIFHGVVVVEHRGHKKPTHTLIRHKLY